MQKSCHPERNTQEVDSKVMGMGRSLNFTRVSIIILNWNGWKDTIECLESLYRINYPNYDVILIDNASQDDSVERIKEYAQGKLKIKSKFFNYNPNNKPIKIFELTENEALCGKFDKPLYEKYDPDRRLILIKNNNNHGFAGGNNIGIKFALTVLDPGAILLLNNDTVVHPHFLHELIKNKKENIGILGPKIYYYDYNGRHNVIHFIGASLTLWNLKEKRYGFNKIDTGEWNEVLEVERINGSCMLIDKSIFTHHILFDDQFFCYFEETDLEYRAKTTGIKLLSVPSSIIWHKVASSTGGVSKPSEFRTFYKFRNGLWFLRKNSSLNTYRLHLLYLFVVGIWIRLAIYTLYHKRPTLFITYLKAIFHGIFDNITSP